MTTPTPIPDFCVSSQADGFDEFLKVFNKHFRKSYIGNLSYYGYLKTESYCGKERLFAPLITPSSAIALLTKPLTEGDLIVGNMFECIEAVRLQGGEGHGKIIYIKGEVYECEYEGCITDHLYERHRFWNLSNEMLNRHFKLIKPAQEEKVNAKIDSLTSQLVQPSLEDELKMSDNPKLKNWGEHISTQEEIVKGEDKIIIGDNENLKCIADQIEQVFKSHLDDETRIELSAKIAYYYFKNAINQYRKWIEESKSETAHLQQQLKEANLLLLNIKNTIELNNIQKVFPETYPQINQFLTRNK